jgi:hypothetical protein
MSDVTILNADADTIQDFGFCGYRDARREGYSRKLEWFKRRLAEGMKYRVLHSERGGAVGFIEYIPGEYAWRAVRADGYMMIHCIANFDRANREKGHGAMLLAECVNDAAREKMHGVAAITHTRGWLPRNEFFLKNGFEVVDTASPDYELLVKKFDDALPPAFRVRENRQLDRYGPGLTLIHTNQCPYVADSVRAVKDTARERYGIDTRIVEVKDCEEAQRAPSVFAIFDLVYKGKLLADHPIGVGIFTRIMEREVG